MAVGEYVTRKFTWLLDNVELVGIVHYISRLDDGETGDDFSIIPDPNYEHLIRYFRGNQPLPWSAQGEPGVMHLETYPIDPGGSNRDDFWPPFGAAPDGTPSWNLPKKTRGEPFVVTDRSGASHDLQVGDRVRVTGRWVIDHHPEYCNLSVPSRCRNLGGPNWWGPSRLFYQKVGQTHTELHPFDWQNIKRVEPLRPGDGSQCRVSLAAPLHEEQYLGAGKWFLNALALTAGRVFVDETPQGIYTNFHTMVGKSIHIAAPPLPPVPASSFRQLVWREQVLKLGQGMRLEDIRTVAVNQNSINVQVTIIAPHNSDGSRPTINGPAQNRWIFQADYLVYWMLAGNEVSCITRGPAPLDIPPPLGPLIGVGGRFPSGEYWWLPIHDAVAAARGGHNFYIRAGLHGERVDLVPLGTGNRETLTAGTPRGRDLLGSLPLCVNPPIIG